MLADYHVHTAFSNDSVYLMEDVVKDAISLEIEDICFTDHVDYGPYRDWDDPRGIEYRAGEEGASLKTLYSSSLAVSVQVWVTAVQEQLKN